MTRLEVRLKRESREAAVSDSETELDLVLFRVPLTNAERGQATSKTYAVRYRDEQDITNRSELYRKKGISNGFHRSVHFRIVFGGGVKNHPYLRKASRVFPSSISL